MFRTFSKLISVALLTITVTGCAFNQHQRAGYGSVEYGVVLNARAASVASNNQEMGIAAVGGLLGGVVGNLLAKDSDWRVKATAVSLGATVGGMTGNLATKAVGATKGQSLVVLNSDLQKLSVTQSVINNEYLQSGDAVYIIRENGGMRVSRIQANDPIGAAFIAGLKGRKIR